ncbi:3-hydroxyacyl-ACP dehydratase FabZ family protein [Micromonospora sp. DT228]|uniref:3-hydroxyacyl-ACP dehydratase FabZ family protein n=1 Tax=Micromonospora sp. DT228 TaxID=3393443 RepID=UPI003CEBB080
MDTAEIRRILPHRFPMLLIDRVESLVPGDSLIATKAVTANEPCYAGLPEEATDYSYPATLLIESWCQAAGVLAVHGTPNPDVLAGRVTLFGAISRIEVLAPVRPGDQVTHHVRALKLLSDAAVFTGESTVADVPVLRVGQVIIALRESAELRSPA